MSEERPEGDICVVLESIGGGLETDFVVTLSFNSLSALGESNTFLWCQCKDICYSNFHMCVHVLNSVLINFIVIIIINIIQLPRILMMKK